MSMRRYKRTFRSHPSLQACPARAWHVTTPEAKLGMEMEELGEQQRSTNSSAESQKRVQAENGGSEVEREEGRALLASDTDGKILHFRRGAN